MESLSGVLTISCTKAISGCESMAVEFHSDGHCFEGSPSGLKL